MMTMRDIMPPPILLTGATGMLGTALTRTLKDFGELYATASRPVTQSAIPFCAFPLENNDYTQLKGFCDPGIIVNCAAMTSIEQCEREPEKARKINALAPEKLAFCFPNAYIIHISTDAVFGAGVHFPNETRPPDPISTYGKTKLDGENRLLSASAHSLVLRTTIVGTGGRRSSPSFTDWLLDTFKAGREAPLFTDVFFTPIDVWHFSEVIQWALRVRPSGVMHAGGGERLSKLEYALLLAKEARMESPPYRSICLAGAAGSKVRRLDQSLDSGYLEQLMAKRLPNVQQSIQSIMRGHA